MIRVVARFVGLLASLLVAACGHGDAYGPPDNPPNGPPVPAERLTFSVEADAFPTWLPDGSGVLYAGPVPERPDGDRCLMLLPADGGRATERWCVGLGAEWDSLNAASASAVSPAGRLTVLVDAGAPNAFSPSTRTLYVGPRDGALRAALGFPFVAASGVLHQTALSIAWTSESTLVYVAGFVAYVGGGGLPPDTITTGLELGHLLLRGDSVVERSVLPGTAGASSVAFDGTALYATLGGDSRVFAVQGSGLQAVHDFAPLGIARDVQVRAGRIAAVVGGQVVWEFDARLGMALQRDLGGPVYLAPLAGGPPVLLTDTTVARSFRRLALSPDGGRLVAEALTGGSEATDLWRVPLP